MRAFLPILLLAPLWLAAPGDAKAGDWRSKYSTGRKGAEFEACCGVKDCRTAKALGYPQMRRLADGSYDVKVGRHWLRYDFPAVHPSEDSDAWVCYLDTPGEPEPLCLFLPKGTS